MLDESFSMSQLEVVTGAVVGLTCSVSWSGCLLAGLPAGRLLLHSNAGV